MLPIRARHAQQSTCLFASTLQCIIGKPQAVTHHLCSVQPPGLIQQSVPTYATLCRALDCTCMQCYHSPRDGTTVGSRDQAAASSRRQQRSPEEACCDQRSSNYMAGCVCSGAEQHAQLHMPATAEGVEHIWLEGSACIAAGRCTAADSSRAASNHSCLLQLLGPPKSRMMHAADTGVALSCAVWKLCVPVLEYLSSTDALADVAGAEYQAHACFSTC